jgi:hypothetical protein
MGNILMSSFQELTIPSCLLYFVSRQDGVDKIQNIPFHDMLHQFSNLNAIALPIRNHKNL